MDERWPHAPKAVRITVRTLLSDMQRLFGPNLLNITLHGSLAMGGSRFPNSDIDLLFLLAHEPSMDAMAVLSATVQHLSSPAVPLELSVLLRGQIHPWRHPAPYIAHWSEGWREHVENDPAHRLPGPGLDPDLAAHLTVARARGISLLGPPPVQIWPEVPVRDYLESVRSDLDGGVDIAGEKPGDLVLNLARTYAYLRDGHIRSKDEGGVYIMDQGPEPYRPVVADALRAYRTGVLPEDPAPIRVDRQRAFFDTVWGHLRARLEIQ